MTAINPNPVPRWKQRGLQRRTELLDATLAIIGREGIDAVSHRRVAETADVALGSTTYHFRSREDMLVQALTYFVELELASLHERFAVPEDAGRDVETLADSLATMLVEQLSGDRERTIAQYALLTEAARRPELHPVARAWNEAWWEMLAPVFAQLGAADPAGEARAFLAMLDGLLLAQLAAPDPTFEDGVLRPALARWLRRIATDPGETH